MSLTLGEWEFLLTKIFALISVIPGLLLIIIYFKRKEWTFSMTLNFNLSISCIIFMISYLFPSVENPNGTNLCKFQVFLGSFGDSSALIWTTIITLMANITFKNNQLLKHENTKKKIILSIIFFSYFIPSIISSVFFLFGDVGKVQDNYYCWIRDYDIKLIHGIIIIIFFFINIISMTKLLFYVKSIISHSFGEQNNLFKIYFNKLILYVIVQIIIYLPIVFHSLCRIFNNYYIYEIITIWLDVTLQVIRTLEGSLFPIVYCYNKKVLLEIKCLIQCQIQLKKKGFYDSSSESDYDENIINKNYYSFDPTDNQLTNSNDFSTIF